MNNYKINNYNYDYIIIGGGPSGILFGYLLDKYLYNYVILEKKDAVGGHYNNFPLTNNFYYDNNVNLFTEEDKFFYKNKNVFLKDLKKHAEKLNIIFNCKVLKINRQNHLICNNRKRFSFKKIINCTGNDLYDNTLNFIINRIYPNIFYRDSINYSLLKKHNFKNKICFIIGLHNESLDLINYLKNYTSNIYFVGKNNTQLQNDNIKLSHSMYNNINYALDVNSMFPDKEKFIICPKEKKLILKNMQKQTINFTNTNNINHDIDYVFVCTQGQKNILVKPHDKSKETEEEINKNIIAIGSYVNNKTIFYNKRRIYNIINCINNQKIDDFTYIIANNFDSFYKYVTNNLDKSKNILYNKDNYYYDNLCKKYKHCKKMVNLNDFKFYFSIYFNQNKNITIETYKKVSKNEDCIKTVFNIDYSCLYYFLKGMVDDLKQKIH